MNIVLSRIDERLIHGQVMTAWLALTKAKRIIVVDDEVYNDDFLIQVLELAAPSNVEIVIYSAEKMAEKYSSNSDNILTIILFKNPLYVLKLLEYDVKLDKVDIGNMGAKPNRNKICKSVYASKSEIELFKKILEKGCKLHIHMLPNDSVKELKDYIKI